MWDEGWRWRCVRKIVHSKKPNYFKYTVGIYTVTRFFGVFGKKKSSRSLCQKNLLSPYNDWAQLLLLLQLQEFSAPCNSPFPRVTATFLLLQLHNQQTFKSILTFLYLIFNCVACLKSALVIQANTFFIKGVIVIESYYHESIQYLLKLIAFFRYLRPATSQKVDSDGGALEE